MKRTLTTLVLCLAIAATAWAEPPRLYVDLNVDMPGIQRERTTTVGETFPIFLVLVNENEEAIKFDEAVLAVYFNDGEPGILGVTPTVYPHAGELAATEGTFDYFGRGALGVNQEMTLLPISSKDLPKPYKNAAGQAGLANYEHLFQVEGDSTTTVAAGKLNAGFRSLATGTSSVLASGPDGSSGFWLDGQEIEVIAMPAIVTVNPQVTSRQSRGK